MKKLALLTILAFGLAPAVFAEKLEGEALCAKCHLKLEEKCRAAVQVKTPDGGTQVYLAEPDLKAKELHSEICKTPKPATVKGAVIDRKGTKFIKIKSFDVK